MRFFITDFYNEALKVYSVGVSFVNSTYQDPEGGFKYSISISLIRWQIMLCFGAYPAEVGK